MTDERKRFKDEVLGKRVEVLFQLDDEGQKEFFAGTIEKMRMQRMKRDGSIKIEHFIEFDDGDRRWFDLEHEAMKDQLRWEEEAQEAQDEKDEEKDGKGEEKEEEVEGKGEEKEEKEEAENGSESPQKRPKIDPEGDETEEEEIDAKVTPKDGAKDVTAEPIMETDA